MGRRLLGAALLALLAGASPALGAISWTSGEVATPSGNTNTFPSVATDRDGTFYAVWRHDTGRVDLASWDGSTWSTLTSFTPAEAGATTVSDDLSLAIYHPAGQSPVFHLAFRAAIGGGTTSERGVWHGSYTAAGGWSFTQLDTYTDPNGWKNTDDPCLALTPSGEPRIAFTYYDVNDPRTYALRYASRDGESWSVTSLRSISGASMDITQPSLFVDAGGREHVSFMQDDGPEDDLWYGLRDGGSWQFERLVAGDPTNAPGEPSSLVVDGAGSVHLVYYEADANAVKYVQGTLGSWYGSTLDDGSAGSFDVGAKAILRINASGALVAAYKKNYGDALRMATRPAGGSWELSDAYTNPGGNSFVANYIGLAVNDSGRVMVLHDRKIVDGDKRVMFTTGQINTLPVVTANPTVSTSEDTDQTFAAGDFNYWDADGDALSHLQVVSLPAAGTLYLDLDGDGVVDASDAVEAGSTVAVAALGAGRLKFKPAPDAHGSPYATFTYRVHDGSDYSAGAATVSVNVTPVADAPAVTAGAGAAYTEGAAGVTVDGALTVADVDSATLTGAVVRVSAGFLPGDELVFTNQNGITGSYDAETGVLTLSGTATRADYEGALRSVTYRSSSEAP